ncbi:MAG TPA: isocitrate lyase/PEP mutase family protein [Casimicrobiaceae bacterium]|nr:isocitrate lyase/PEP mutase family protein [Casimicrobiaceae bacterium]
MPSTPTKAARLRQLLRDARPLVSPGVYDGYSVRLVEAMGFKTAATTGSGLSNTLLAQPDIGILSLLENVDACRHLARSVSIPLTADADTGYGNAVTVFHTVQYFEEAGVVGINLEDQVMPKRCGHMRGKEIVSTAEMCKKIEAAVKARKDPDFVINARTDSIAIGGIDEAVARARAYAAAGADMIYPDAIRSEDDIKRIVEAVPNLPVNINMGFGIRSRPTSPLIPLRRLKELGVARVSCPRMLTAAAISGMKKALEQMRECIETGDAADRPDLLVGIEEITALMGYARIAELENAFTLEEDLARKYGDAERNYVVRARPPGIAE